MKTTDQIKQRFEARYQMGDTPWVPQMIPPEIKRFAKLVDQDFSSPSLLDLGCGNGVIACYFAAQNFRVTGIDSSPTAISQAKALALKQQLKVTFRVGDALDLNFSEQSFDAVFDRGLLHHQPPQEWSRYLRGLNQAIKPGGYYFLSVFYQKDAKPKGQSLTDATGYQSYNHFFDEALLTDLFGQTFTFTHKDFVTSRSGSKLVNYVMRKK